MKKEIGSNFWFSQEEINLDNNAINANSLELCGDDIVWLSSARLGIKLTLETIEKETPNKAKIALLPSYTCWTVIAPFVANAYKVVTYSIDKDMACREKEVMQLVTDEAPSVFLFHDYFGFPTISKNSTLLSEIKKKGVIIIEDRTQTVYSDFQSSQADYQVGSLRKWCGIPDGAYAVKRNGTFCKRPEEYNHQLESAKTKASLIKHKYMTEDAGEKAEFLALFRKGEELIDTPQKVYAISPNSVSIQSKLNISYLKDSRRDNYAYLHKALMGTKGIEILFNDLPEGIVPLYFPILCKDREYVQHELAQHNIYAPVIWPKPPQYKELKLSVDTEYLYQHLLCLPIDQRYDLTDMKRLAHTLRLIAQNEYKFGWMDWDEISKYREQLIDMEYSLMIDFHYPDWSIPREFVAQKIADLETHLVNGNTRFWGIRNASELLGYYWAYTAPFINKKRWNLRSIYFDDRLRGEGLGTLSMMEAEIKARELGCNQIATDYAVFNTSMESCLKKNGFNACRVEMIKDLDKNHE